MTTVSLTYSSLKNGCVTFGVCAENPSDQKMAFFAKHIFQSFYLFVQESAIVSCEPAHKRIQLEVKEPQALVSTFFSTHAYLRCTQKHHTFEVYPTIFERQLTAWAERETHGKRVEEHVKVALSRQRGQLRFSCLHLHTLPRGLACVQDFLTYLDLSGNEFSSIPPVVFSLKELECLQLEGNALSELDARILQLKKLKDINLSSNDFEEFPSVLFQHTALRVISLAGNTFSRLPLNPPLCQRLEFLDLSSNKQIKYLPLSLGLCRSLKDVRTLFCGLSSHDKLIILEMAQRKETSPLLRLWMARLALSRMSEDESFDLSHLESEKQELLFKLLMDRAGLSPAKDTIWRALEELSIAFEGLARKNPPDKVQETYAYFVESYFEVRKDLMGWASGDGRKEKVVYDLLTAYVKKEKKLDLSFLSLELLPSSLERFSYVEELDITGNSLERIPNEVLLMKRLKRLFCAENNLKSLPARLYYLRTLEVLDVRHNPLLGYLPMRLYECVHLRNIYDEGTQINEWQRDLIFCAIENERMGKKERPLDILWSSWKHFSLLTIDIQWDHLSIERQAAIFEFLLRQSHTEVSVRYVQMVATFLSQLLALVIEERERAFSELFFMHIEANLTHCEDRAGQLLNELYTLYKVHTVRADRKGVEIFLRAGKTLKLRKAVAQLIHKHASGDRESAEVFLYVEMKLAKKLNLLSLAKEMRYVETAQRPWLDLAHLCREVERADPVDLLCDLGFWESYVKFHYKSELEHIQGKERLKLHQRLVEVEEAKCVDGEKMRDLFQLRTDWDSMEERALRALSMQLLIEK